MGTYPVCLLLLPTCCRVARSQMRTVWSRDTVAICPRFCSVESANTGAMWDRANTVYSREGTSRKPRWPEVVVDSTRRPSGLKETELTGPSCSVGRMGKWPLGPASFRDDSRRADTTPPHTLHGQGTEVPETQTPCSSAAKVSRVLRVSCPLATAPKAPAKAACREHWDC